MGKLIELFKYILLSIVQGLGEVLPISSGSTAHFKEIPPLYAIDHEVFAISSCSTTILHPLSLYSAALPEESPISSWTTAHLKVIPPFYGIEHEVLAISSWTSNARHR